MAGETNAQGARQDAEIIVPAAAQQTYESWGFAPAIKVGNTIYVSGVISGLDGEGTDEERYARGFVRALKRIEEVLAAAGADLDDIVEFTTFHTDLQRQLETAVKVRMENMNPPHPAWTAVGTTALASPDGMTEIKVIAHVSE
jgi:enamine deaminase RidA (YjgF/YER057c/UK114 family)